MQLLRYVNKYLTEWWCGKQSCFGKKQSAFNEVEVIINNGELIRLYKMLSTWPVVGSVHSRSGFVAFRRFLEMC